MLFSTASTVEYSVVRRLSNIESNQFSRASERSRTITRAPMPTAMRAALYPTTPPPMITTSADGTPGTPPSKTPLPPCALSIPCPPAWHDLRQATSPIGASRGRPPCTPVTLSYATAPHQYHKHAQ